MKKAERELKRTQRIVAEWNKRIAAEREELVLQIQALEPGYNSDLLQAYGKEHGNVKLGEVLHTIQQHRKLTTLFTL